MNKEIQVRIILRHKTSRQWEQIGDSEVLFKGEIGLEFIGGNNVPKIKIGDGITPWKKLKYYHPTKYNWNDLMGTTYDFQRSTTPGLNLNKPGAKDIVNLITLNENFDILDSNYNRQLQEIKNLQEGINNLTSIIDSSELNSVEAEVVLARTINNVTYGSLSEALNALSRNLQILEDELKNKTPTGIKITEDGAIYLADASGSIIGEEVRVIDLELRDEVEDARKRSSGVTYESIGKTLRAIDDDLQLEINNLKNELEEKANQEDIDNSIQEVELALSAHIEEANNDNLAIQESLESISENITTVAEELSNELKEQENALSDLSASFSNYKTEAEIQNDEFLEQLNNQNKDIENLENLLNYKEQQLNNSIELQKRNFDKKLDNYKEEVSENFQISDSKIRSNTQRISSLEDEIENLPSLFPDNLVYEDNILYLAVGDEIIETSGVEIVGGGGGGGIDTTYKIELTAEERNISKPLGDTVEIKFNYLSYDREDSTVNDGPGSGILLVDNIQRATFRVPQGQNTLDVTQYLSAGENTIKIKVTNSEGSSKVLQFNIVLLSLSISTPFPAMSHQSVGILPISYTVRSEAEFTAHFVLTKQSARPGEQYSEPTEIVTETFNKGTTSTVYIPALPSGAYSLDIYATSGDITSNIITLGLIMYSSSDVFPFIVMIPERKFYQQGETVNISYLVYDPNNTSPQISFSTYSVSEEGEEVLFASDSFNVDRNPKEINAQKYPTGKVIFELSCGDTKNRVEIEIEESDIELELFTNGLLFEFDPIGRTNQNSANNWSYTDSNETTYTASFTGIDWGEQDGWQIKKDNSGKPLEDQTMLRILPGGSMTIPFTFFNEEIVNNNIGYTIEMELATQNVTNYESLIIDAFDETVDYERGLRVYSQSAELKSKNNKISAQFREDERIRLAFTIEPETQNKLIKVYINGVLCSIKRYDSDEFKQENPAPIVVGALDNGVDIYFIRAYKRVLDYSQQLNNFCVDRPSFNEKVAAKIRNDIVNASAGGDLSKMITINSLKGMVPYIIIHAAKLPENKDQDKFKGVKITFVDPFDPSRNFTAENCTLSIQGTSSAGYPVKNFKIKLDKIAGIVYTQSGKTEKGFYFEGKENSQITKVICLKADYASSESANNVMLVDYYNQTPWCSCALPTTPFVARLFLWLTSRLLPRSLTSTTSPSSWIPLVGLRTLTSSR